MGTRADFYVGRGADAEWLGSCAFDGFPENMADDIKAAGSEDAFRKAVERRLANDDGTHPSDGWPWPWDDSLTTDYAYAFDDGRVWASSFGRAWFEPIGDEPEHPDAQVAVFPDMSERKNVTFGPRSGLTVFVL